MELSCERCGRTTPGQESAPGQASRSSCPSCGGELRRIGPGTFETDPFGLGESATEAGPGTGGANVFATQPFGPPPLRPGAEAFFTVLGAPAGQEQIRLAGARTVVGREGADVHLPDPDASDRHFQVDVVGSEFLIRDLGSRHGTFVNGARVRYCELLPGDAVRAGRTILIFGTSDDRLQRPMSPAIPPLKDPARPAAGEPWTTTHPTRPFPPGAAAAGPGSLAAGGSRGTPLPPEPPGVHARRAQHDEPVDIVLEVVKGPDAGKTFLLSRRRSVVGRGFVDVVVRDFAASTRHAEIAVEGAGLYHLKDLASTSGTRLNGERVTVARLSDGDRIEVGDTTLRFVVKEKPV